MPRTHAEQQHYDATVASCRAALGVATAEDAIATGHALPPVDAVTNAFAWLDTLAFDTVDAGSRV